MFAGSGTITVNERTLEDYFPRPTSRMRILEPFEATETAGQYDVLVSVEGGGIARSCLTPSAWEFHALSLPRPIRCARRCARPGC